MPDDDRIAAAQVAGGPTRSSRPRSRVIAAFFVLPLILSAVLAFRGNGGGFTLEHFEKAWDLYQTDLLFTVGIVSLSTLLIALVAIAIAGYLTLGENPRAVAILRWLYRWPLFIPFIVAGQIMRTFLAKNGMLNHVLIGTGLIEPLQAQSVLDWRGIVIAFVWKQAPFVTLLLAGAMASLERAAHRGGAQPRRAALRVLIDIVLPQVRGTLLVGLVLSFVTMLSVLSVPLMINPNSPTMITVDVAYRINTHGDYAVGQCALPDVAGRRGGRRVVLPAARGAREEHERRPAAARNPRVASPTLARRRAVVLGAGRVRRSSGRSPTCSCGRSPSAGTSRASCRRNSASRSGSACSARAATRSRRWGRASGSRS